MEMLNPHCGISRDERGVVRLAVCNAGSLNIVNSAVTDGVREGFERLAADTGIRVVILTGESEKA
jgi:enoyl-CoA hydratase/carnithine racemase